LFYILQADIIADIQADVDAYYPVVGAQHQSWFKRLQDKLRRAYGVLTCTDAGDVVPRHAPPRPPRHSSARLLGAAQVSPPRDTTRRHDPRPRFTPQQSPCIRPTDHTFASTSRQPDAIDPGPSQPPLSQIPVYVSGPSQPTMFMPATSHSPLFMSGPAQPPLFMPGSSSWQAHTPPFTGMPYSYGYGGGPQFVGASHQPQMANLTGQYSQQLMHGG
jgi:hypothetical protein